MVRWNYPIFTLLLELLHNMAYTFFLYTHSWIRWVVLIVAIVLVIKSLIGLFGSKPYQKLDNALSASFVGFMHLQLLIGLVLYFFLSPLTEYAMKDMGSAMRDGELRFWAVEHLTVMILAIVFAQVGRSISKRSEDNSVKFRFQAIFFGAALLLMIIGIPWGEAVRNFRF
ncbi:MAG: hypothetical protein AAGA85_15820 [Bacteroidota bacterium]